MSQTRRRTRHQIHGSDGRGDRSWCKAHSFRRIRPILLLVLSLVVAGVGALQAHRAQRSHKMVAETLVRDYAAFAAWSFNQRAAEQVASAIRGSLYPLRTGLLYANRPEGCLVEVLAAARSNGFCQCEEPIGGSFSFFVSLAPDSGAARFVGAPPDRRGQEALVDALRAHSSIHYRPQWGHALLRVERPGGGDWLLAYVRLDDPDGTSVLYGVEVDPALLARRFESVYESAALLPSSLTRGASNRELLALSAHAPSAREIFSSHPGRQIDSTGEMLAPAVGGGAVRATVLPAAADRLIIGGLPKSRVPWLLVIFGLSGALALAAISQFRKENRLTRLRSDFVASMSHELRTPLALQRIFLDMLKLGRARTEAHGQWSIASIDRENLRLTHLVENVLTFARVEQQQMRISPVSGDLSRIVHEAVDAFAPLADSARVRIDLEIQEGIVATADAPALHRVITNLLENAIKYGPEGGRVVVGLRLNGTQAHLTVDDDGPGVPNEERSAVFEPFRRGERHVGTATVGSGIGLAVVREIVHLHRGSIEIEEAPSGGARLHVRLPGARCDRGTARRRAAASEYVSSGLEVPPPASVRAIHG